MPRKAREKSAVDIYHVMLRGINRQDIFEEPEDYWELIKILSSLSELLAEDLVTKLRPSYIYAYCLMPNHVHLLIHEKQWSIGQCVKYIADRYVRYYNKKYGRVGHLFQDRFKSEPCDTSDYFFVLMRYIHQNPVKAGLVKTAKDYQYSSWGNDYLGLGAIHVSQTDAVIQRYTFKELAAWVDMPLPEKYGFLDIEERRVTADTEVRDFLIKKSGSRTMSDFQLLTRERQKDILRDAIQILNCGPRQLSRVSGISYNIIYALYKT